MKKIFFLSAVLLLLLFVFSACTHENVKTQVIYNAVTDIDGNNYDAVVIGNQVWMKSNLRTRHFRNGVEIPVLEGDYNVAFGSYCAFEPTIDQYPGFVKQLDGLYYNIYAVEDERDLCPEGWHIPSDSDWQALSVFLIENLDYQHVAKALASTTGWHDSYYFSTPGWHPQTNNTTGFDARPVYKIQNYYGNYYDNSSNIQLDSSYDRIVVYWSSANKDTLLYSYDSGPRYQNTHSNYGFYFDGMTLLHFHENIYYSDGYYGQEYYGQKSNFYPVRCISDKR